MGPLKCTYLSTLGFLESSRVWDRLFYWTWKYWNLLSCKLVWEFLQHIHMILHGEAHSWVVVKNQLHSLMQCLRSLQEEIPLCPCLHWIGYIQICLGLDPPWYGSTLFTQDWFGNKNSIILYCITFISGPIWYQIADLIHTGSTRSHVNTRLVCTNFIPVPNRSVTL